MTEKDSILVIDDEPGICRSIQIVLGGAGYAVETAGTAAEALQRLEQRSFDLAVVDVRLPDLDGIELIGKLHNLDPDLALVVISGHGTIADAVRATQMGAYDFLEKPLHRERLLLSVQRALEHRRLSEISQRLQRQKGTDEMIGQSPPLQELRRAIELAAPTRGRILITGESGTGKELVARAIHRISPLRDGPFVKINCAAIPSTLIESELFGYEKGAFTGAMHSQKGRFEDAHNGTLFMDEVGDMGLEVQAKLLRVLQDGELRRVGGGRTIRVSVRLLAATNKSLQAEVEAGRFREDLYFRINVIPLEVPPLRRRREDIPLLAEHFCRELCRENALPLKRPGKEALRRLQAYDWPGNIRELRNILERALILGGPSEEIHEKDLQLLLSPRTEMLTESGNETLRQYLRRAEKHYIRRKLEGAEWNVTRAADELGLERTNLHRKMRQHRLQRPVESEKTRGSSP